MDRRFLTVLGVSLVFALVVAGIFYQMTSGQAGASARKSAGDLRDVVMAAKPLPVGVTVKATDVTLAKVPPAQFPKGAFSKVDDVVGRPVISNVLIDEPLLEGRLAAKGSGLGIAPVIPVGMRAVSVRVNDVVGVAGFVLPGMRVDVLVTGNPPGKPERLTTTVLQNILVLSAGQTVQADAKGQAINAPSVTLLVTPAEAETVTLAQREGEIQLVLRNGTDHRLETTRGRYVSELFGGTRTFSAAARPAPARVAVPAVARMVPPPVPAPAPPPEVVVFRGIVRTAEKVPAPPAEAAGNTQEDHQ